MKSLNEFLSHIKGVEKHGDRYMACCPAHDDEKRSLSIGLSANGEKILINCFAGCSTEDIVSAMGMKMSNLFIGDKSYKHGKRIITKTPYHYYDEDGTLLYTKIRMDYEDGTKSFCFVQPNGVKGVKGIKRVPYNLPDVCKAQKIYFVEGEKCADAVINQGFCATTLDSGSQSKWYPEYNNYFVGKEIIIIPDNDEPGIRYAKSIAKHISGARIVRIPEREGKDE